MKAVAVIGLGNIASRHRRNLKKLLPDANLYAMSSRGRVPDGRVEDCDGVVTGIESLLDTGVEMVIVASPATLHADHALPLLEAGIPVLIEKPVCADATDGTRLLEASHNSAPCAVAYCLRYLPAMGFVREVIHRGQLGEIYSAFVEVGQYLPDWRPGIDYRNSVSAQSVLGGGALLELSHELDYVQWLLGAVTLKYASVRRAGNLEVDVEDTVDAVATTASGTVVTIHLDFLQRVACRRCHLLGQDGRLEWDLVENRVTVYDGSGEREVFAEPGWDRNRMYTLMLEDFFRKCRGEPHSCVSVEDAVNCLLLIEEVRKYGCNNHEC